MAKRRVVAQSCVLQDHRRDKKDERSESRIPLGLGGVFGAPRTIESRSRVPDDMRTPQDRTLGTDQKVLRLHGNFGKRDAVVRRDAYELAELVNADHLTDS